MGTKRQNHSADNLDEAFLQRLEAFAKNGYRFDGSHALKPGTQREAFDGYLHGLRHGHRQGYYEIPTGVGKTALFLSLVKTYLDATNAQAENKRVLVVVPSIVLVKQAFRDFAKFLPEIAPRIEGADDSGHTIDLKKLDWDSGSLGLQFHKLKHAARKPRVLITTYASLNRDKDNAVCDPNDIGLVVYDEGHSITGENTGKAVERFKDALQLAVTATPDYSEDKRIGQKLPHCYYRLPLADAIKRGDLCGVRPILIKTNYTVDAKKVDEFIRANKGRPLTDAQLQHLFNVEARNRSVIETYLSAHDPDSGERFLGQNGLIFSGGIKHADDLVRQFHKALGERRFASIRGWLAEENLEIAASMHSGVDGAWLRPGLLSGSGGDRNRKRQGQREWYTEDEIRRLHEQGKILLLISDKKLREGYDCPKDSIVIDMVDRLSVVDVTQRFGRGFRLDPGDGDKVCTPINLVDANTHEIYKDRPQMLPIYAAEILAGAEFRKPMKRHLTRRFSHEIPEADEALSHGRFEVVSNPEVVRQHSRKHKEARAALVPRLPADKQHWLTGIALLNFLSVSPTPDIQDRLNAVLNDLNDHPDRTIEISGKPQLLGSLIGRFRNSKSGPEGSLYVDPDLGPIILHALGVAPFLPADKEHWLSGHAMLGLLKLRSSGQMYQRVMSALEELVREPQREVAVNGHVRSIASLTGRYRNTTSGHEGVIYADPQLAPVVLQTMGIAPWLPEDRQHWITGIAILNALGLPRNNEQRKKLDTVLDALMDEADRQSQGGGSLDGKIMRFRNKRSGEEGSVYVDPVLIESGILTKQMVKNATVGDATGHDASKTARHNRNGAQPWSQRHERSEICPGSSHIQRTDRNRGK